MDLGRTAGLNAHEADTEVRVRWMVAAASTDLLWLLVPIPRLRHVALSLSAAGRKKTVATH